MSRFRSLVSLVALLAVGAFLLPASAGAFTAPVPASTAERVAGTDRYLTSVEASKRLPRGQNFVVLASGDNFPDALAAATASKAPDGSFAPILLTNPTSLPKGVKDEIARRLGPNDTVWIIGGPQAVSPAIDFELAAAGYNVKRLTSTQTPGAPTQDRYDTAAAVAAQFAPGTGGPLPAVILATGLNFPDALAASTFAAANQIPVLLATPSGIPKATQDFLDAHTGSGTTVYLIGGTQAVAAPAGPAGVVFRRVAGFDRYTTAREVARQLWGRTAPSDTRNEVVLLARADLFPDALAGGPLGAATAAPLLLTDTGSLSPPTAAYAVGDLGYDRPLHPALSYVLGGKLAIADATVTQWTNALNGLAVTSNRSSTFRDTAEGGSVSNAGQAIVGCTDVSGNDTGRRQQFTNLAVKGDLAGTLTLKDVDFCTFNAPLGSGTPPVFPPPNGDIELVLPGSPVTFTPTGGSAITGFVSGGLAGEEQGNQFQGLNRATTIDFVLPSANTVGHLSFSNAQSSIANGFLALVLGATSQPFRGTFSGFPTTGCSTVSLDTGAIGADAVSISSLIACRLPKAGSSTATPDIWRIGTGTITGAVTGQVVSGIRRGSKLGLQIRTSTGLIDVFAVVDDTGFASPSASSALVQRLPVDDETVAFQASAASGAAAATQGCAAGGLLAGRNLTGTVHAASFPTTANGLQVLGMRECQTDASLGLVEPDPSVGNPEGPPAPPSTTSPDPLARPVLYGTPFTALPYRGRLLYGSFFQDPSGLRTFGLTLLIEENNRQTVATQAPPGGTVQVDAPGNSFTIIRLVVSGLPGTNTLGSGSGPVTLAR